MSRVPLNNNITSTNEVPQYPQGYACTFVSRLLCRGRSRNREIILSFNLNVCFVKHARSVADTQPSATRTHRHRHWHLHVFDVSTGSTAFRYPLTLNGVGVGSRRFRSNCNGPLWSGDLEVHVDIKFRSSRRVNLEVS
ncbi:hypothetical protein CBL_13428 [Carabus blaptoides fortunei]